MRTRDPSPVIVRPSFTLFGQRWPFYGLFVWCGTLSGILVAFSLGFASGASPGSIAIALLAGLLSAGALALGTQVLTGREVYTFYHYQIAIITAGGAVLTLSGRPALPALDAIGPALAVIQAFGRLGCFMAACCHGRPGRWGVCYGDEHADKGFARELVGVRLFPIQLLESLCLFALAGLTAAVVIVQEPAGVALATYLVGHGAMRFCLEFARGDDVRPYAFGLSEAQWTAAAVIVTAIGAESGGALPIARGHVAVAAVVGLVATIAALYRRVRPSQVLFRPRHVSEIARTLDDLALTPVGPGDAPRVARTSLGLGLSVGSLHHGRAHYSLSTRGAALTVPTAKRVATLIVLLRHPRSPSRLIAGGHGVFHLVIEAAA